ncbi:hypothetical protein [Novosphingobium panipatense]|uniref:hypothetical protein n=1 Tax=Novosphingobium panipatense TaxID=428991 RepID=UPI0036122E26
MTEELSRMRTVALQAEVAKNQHLANAVLLDALLPILAESHPDAHAVQLRASTDIQEPAQHFDYNTREMSSPYAGVADLIAGAPKKAANRFAWVLALDDADIARLLAACTAALIDGRHAKYADPERLRSVDRIARAASLDMRDHWEGGVEFFGAITKKAMLAALTEACGPAAAENCEKMPKGKLAEACAERIPGRGWLPLPSSPRTNPKSSRRTRQSRRTTMARISTPVRSKRWMSAPLPRPTTTPTSILRSLPSETGGPLLRGGPLPQHPKFKDNSHAAL